MGIRFKRTHKKKGKKGKNKSKEPFSYSAFLDHCVAAFKAASRRSRGGSRGGSDGVNFFKGCWQVSSREHPDILTPDRYHEFLKEARQMVTKDKKVKKEPRKEARRIVIRVEPTIRKKVRRKLKLKRSKDR